MSSQFIYFRTLFYSGWLNWICSFITLLLSLFWYIARNKEPYFVWLHWIYLFGDSHLVIQLFGDNKGIRWYGNHSNTIIICTYTSLEQLHFWLCKIKRAGVLNATEWLPVKNAHHVHIFILCISKTSLHANLKNQALRHLLLLYLAFSLAVSATFQFAHNPYWYIKT